MLRCLPQPNGRQPWYTLDSDRVVQEGQIVKGGGNQQYAYVLLELIAHSKNTAVILEKTLFMRDIPDHCLIGVEEGMRQFCMTGGPDGSPIVGVHARLWELKYHPVHSKRETFQQATMMALGAGFQKGGFKEWK